MNRSISIKIKDNTYSTNWPTNGQFLDIEVLKASLAKDKYYSLLQSNSYLSNAALNNIDTTAYFTVLFPQLIKDLKVSSLLDLDAVDFAILSDAFKNQLLPWLKVWLDAFKNAYDPKENPAIANDSQSNSAEPS